MEKLRQGEEKRLAHYFSTYYKALVFFAKRYIADEAEAEDIAEEAFIKLWERREQFANEKVMKAYLYRTVSHACIDLLRRKKIKGAREKEHSYLSAAATEAHALEGMIRTEVIKELHAALQELPPVCRAVILKSFIEGKDPASIATELKISVNTVRSHKFRGLQLLRKKIAIPLLLAAAMLPV
ncbi:MAG: RNA polymerase sigma-70 factor [Chitinophagaceae bacterium]|nr:RNA polymerase sigma-70 factor [Chitinophagaceae bacterium]